MLVLKCNTPHEQYQSFTEPFLSVIQYFLQRERRSRAFQPHFNNGNGVPTRSPSKWPLENKSYHRYNRIVNIHVIDYWTNLTEEHVARWRVDREHVVLLWMFGNRLSKSCTYNCVNEQQQNKSLTQGSGCVRSTTPFKTQLILNQPEIILNFEHC